MTETDFAHLKRTPAEKWAASVLPAEALLWAAAEGMHLGEIHAVLPVAGGTAVAAALAWGASGRRDDVPASLPWWIAVEGAWLTAADALGPLYWWPAPALTAALAVIALAARRAACRHEAVLQARQWRETKTAWLEKRHRWGFGGAHLLDYRETEVGEWYLVSTKGTGKPAAHFTRGVHAETIAEDLDLQPSRVQVKRHLLAGRVEITIRTRDPWAKVLLHPLTAPAPGIELPARRTVRDPAPVGQNRDTGKVLAVPLCDETGGKNVSVTAIKGGGKALALDTPLPTPSGWTTMGAVKAGDWLIGRDGKPTRVTAATRVMHGHDCYDVQFTDGSTITADADHLWLTEDRRAWRSARLARLGKHPQTIFPEVRTTAEIAATLKESVGPSGLTSNHAVANCAPFDLPDADLPIPPYTLGAWLGDGTARKAEITSADPEVIARIEADGFRVRKAGHHNPYAWRMAFTREVPELLSFRSRYATQRTCSHACGAAWRASGGRRSMQCGRCGSRISGTGELCRPCWVATNTFVGALKSLGIYGDKRIPGIYLRASERQRRELLAGLLDTDGYCGKNGGVELGVTIPRLAHGVRELVSSLGYSSQIREKPVMWKGSRSSTCYTVSFTPPDKVFSLTRKAERQNAAKGVIALRRLITDVRPVPSVPVRCIQVDNADKLYLAGPTAIPTHNTVLFDNISEHVTACPDALMIRVNISVKGYAEAASWGPACHLTAFGSDQKSRAAAVLKVICQVIEWRARTYKRGVYEPSPQDPLIVLITDESDSAAAVPAVRALLNDIATKGREYGVAHVHAGQRATYDYTSGKQKTQDDVYCTGMVSRRGEVRHAAGSMAHQVPDMATYGEGKPGVWSVAVLGAGQQDGRTWVFDASPAGHAAHVERIAAERARSQPELPAACREYLGTAYEVLLSTDVFARWARGTEDDADAPGGAAPAAPDVPAPDDGTQPEPVATGSVAVAEADVAGRLERELDVDEDTRAAFATLDEKLRAVRLMNAETAAMPRPQVSPQEASAATEEAWRQVGEQAEIPPEAAEGLLGMLREGTTAGSVAQAFGVSKWIARTWLEKLRGQGAAYVDGERKAARWRLTPPPAQDDAQ
jgi:hypothetical protein